MDILTALKISGSGLKAERARLNVTAMNLANANTTRTMEGGPYKAKSVVFGARPVDNFRDTLNSTQARLRQVEVVKVVEDDKPFKEVYDPSHPDADERGIVQFPNVDTAEQMVDILSARRGYDANVTAIDAVKSMALKALDISR
ncbi:MAG: flagellar basal body rod protein FlgC [Desulfobulbaceae bacterium]|nr:MAG: flagellar basal body rod protein FlgC [Desulfobulbaceae bacterium]